MCPMMLQMLSMEAFQKKREKELQPQQEVLPKYQQLARERMVNYSAVLLPERLQQVVLQDLDAQKFFLVELVQIHIRITQKWLA